MQFFVNSVPVCGDTVPLGVQGENLATQITADVSGWLDQWPDGQVIVRLIDANRQSHLADTVVNDGTLVWIVTAADTAQGGYGVGVIELVQGDVVKKSEPFATRVITDPQASGQAPEPVPGWVEETIARMEELEAGAAQSAGAAQASAGSAQTGAQSAQAAAAQAAQSAEDAADVLPQVETAGAAQVTAIQAAGQQQTQAVNTAGAQQVSAVQTEGADQRSAIQTAGAAQVAAIQAEGQTQQTAIQQKGADTLASIPDDYTELSGDVADLKSQITQTQDDVSKASYIDTAIAGTKNAGFFIDSGGKLRAGGSQYCVTTFPVTQGEKYRIIGDGVKLYGNYGLVCFATTSTAEADKQLTLIQMGSSTATDYDFYYTPQEDGYLFCAWIDAGGYTQLSVFLSEPVSSVIDEQLNANIAEFGTKNSGCFILSSGKIIVGGSAQLCISTFPVTQGIKYRIIGQGVKLLGNYGLVGFATTSTVVSDKQTVLLQMGSSTATDYDFYYVPPENGYLFCAWVDASGYTQLSVCTLEPVVDAIDDLLRYTQWSNVPIKVQVFGDSISDDSSRTTWATLISTYLAQRTINLINSAVGGSSYGHGHIDGKYGDHPDGNMVNDLLKDGTLETDADIIVMFAGTNNWAGETPLGQWGDDTIGTFYGDVRDAFDYLSTHTNALVIVCTPCGRYNSTDASRSKNSDGLVLNPQGKTLRQFCDAIVETAHLYQYPVVDLYYDLGWNINNVSHYTEDGLHPNLIGAKFLSHFIVGRMKTHIGI